MKLLINVGYRRVVQCILENLNVLSNKNGFGYKMPKLVELHNHLFGKTHQTCTIH